VVLSVFIKFFLNSYSKNALFVKLLLGIFQIFFDCLGVFFKKLFVCGLLVKFGLEFSFELLQSQFVFSVDFRNEHTVVSAAAVLQQDGEHLPDIGNDYVFLVTMLQNLSYKFIEPNRINKQGSIHPISQIVRNTKQLEGNAVDAVARNGVFMFGLEDQTWNFQMLRVCESVVDPRFKHFHSHLHLVVLRFETCAGSATSDAYSLLVFVTTVVH